MRHLCLLALAAVALAGCATTSPDEATRELFQHRRSVALDDYSSGSGWGGSDLLLFADGHWEYWFYGCTGTSLHAFGHYEKRGRTIVFTKKGLPSQTLYLYRDNSEDYLLTHQQLRHGLPAPRATSERPYDRTQIFQDTATPLRREKPAE